MLELKTHVDNGKGKIREISLQFEHSLLSLSKWEAKHKKPFLSREPHTHSEMIDYFQDMLLTPGVDPSVVYRLTPDQLDELADYINDPQTASKVNHDEPPRSSGEQVTSELIYYWLVALKIPFHPTETWHINRIMMLVQITNVKNQPPKKRNPVEVMKDWRAENERRKKLLGTSG